MVLAAGQVARAAQGRLQTTTEELVVLVQMHSLVGLVAAQADQEERGRKAAQAEMEATNPEREEEATEGVA